MDAFEKKHLQEVEDKFFIMGGIVIDVFPSLRPCPKCAVIIEHIGACRWMTCNCGCEFCFVCGDTECRRKNPKVATSQACPQGYKSNH